MTPIVQNISSLTEVNISLPATLACLTTGYPLPDITWEKDGGDVVMSMDGRVSFFAFTTDTMDTVGVNESSGYESSGYDGSDPIVNLLEMAGFSRSDAQGLGELGVVGLLTFRDVERDDTASYTCTATNSLPQTTTLSTESDPIQMTVLGMSSVCL